MPDCDSKWSLRIARVRVIHNLMICLVEKTWIFDEFVYVLVAHVIQSMYVVKYGLVRIKIRSKIGRILVKILENACTIQNMGLVVPESQTRDTRVLPRIEQSSTKLRYRQL